ncbi:MAG: hypothetical protein DRP27_09360 [Thermotogae bacterium]|nr:MAG: hypothetical protein DRP27_09360 [Thermotogota bacterium]
MIRTNIALRIGTFLTHPYLTLATRLILGGLFIFAGAMKLPYLMTFAGEVNKYHILPYSLAQIYAFTLPGVEVALGLFLVLGLFLRSSAAVSILLTISFVIAKSVALAQGMGVEPCWCFGPARTLMLTHTLALDFVMLVLALQILFHRGEFLALGPWLYRIARRIY